MKTLEYWCFGVTVAILSFCAGAATAQNSMMPPPPAVNYGATCDQFSERDRAKLNAIFRMCRAMHTKLFPLSEEQKLLNGGSVDFSQ